MGASWCKEYSESAGAGSSLQTLLTKWSSKINCSNEETKWNWKWARRRQTKWKDRPEISAPRLLNPCFLEGAKWDNVILSVPDPEKSRPVAPPRRKRKRLPNPDATAYHGSFPDFLQQARCLDLGTDTSMSLSSLDPLGPRTPRTPRSALGPRRRLSSDLSDCDCSISSRTSLASIPVTDELYRKHHFLSISGSSFNVTQASLLSASTSSFKRTQNQKYTIKRRSTLQNITKKYNLTLSLPNLNLISKLSTRPSRDFTSLPDLRCGDVSKEAVMYAVMYGIKNEFTGNTRGRVSLKGLRARPRRDSEGARRGFPARSASQLSVSRFGSNLTGTFRESSAICEDQEEVTDCQNGNEDDHLRWPKSRSNCSSDQDESKICSNDRGKLSEENSVWSNKNDLSSQSVDNEPSLNLTGSTNRDLVDKSGVSRTADPTETKVPSISSQATLQTENSDASIAAHKTLTSQCPEETKDMCFDGSDKENLDTNLLLKYRNLKKSPRYLKTFRRLSQRQTEKVGCPLFFDKHHSCTCLRPRVKGQRFQSMSALPAAKPVLRNGLKKSLSVNHAQPVWKTSRCDVTQNCCGTRSDKNNNCRGSSPMIFENTFVTSIPYKPIVSGCNGGERFLVNGFTPSVTNILQEELNCNSKQAEVDFPSLVNGGERIYFNGFAPSVVDLMQKESNCDSRRAAMDSPSLSNEYAAVNGFNTDLVQKELNCNSRQAETDGSSRINGGERILINGFVPSVADLRQAENDDHTSLVKKEADDQKLDESILNRSSENRHVLDTLGQRDADTSTLLVDPSVKRDQVVTLKKSPKEEFIDHESGVIQILRTRLTEKRSGATLKQVTDCVTCDDSVVDFGDSFVDDVVKIDVTPPSRSSSTSGSLCELEDDIYDMLVIASNQQTAEVKN
nr:PREDICTED: uncharacterized protein LOC109033077 [Bemisia tabaci]XP_018901053.1 PREDICTED: uncharacterized protein LOC109033077 [Bemisia tabaci]